MIGPGLLFSTIAQINVGGTGERPGIFEQFLQSGPMGKAVFAVLALFSLVSWTIMIGKYFQLARSSRHTRAFLDTFRRSRKFSEVNAATSRHVASPMVGLFQAGYVEIDSQVKARRKRIKMILICRSLMEDTIRGTSQISSSILVGIKCNK